MREFRELTIATFHAGLLAGECTAVELVDFYLQRIEHCADGSVVTVNPAAREEAAACDAYLAAHGRLAGQLHGVPVLVKDQAETAGLRTTFGSILFADYVPETDAHVITRLKAAGAIVLAKTSMCDFAAGWFSSSSLTGHTPNLYVPGRDSGGSSAGTAAGLARRLGLVGIGEDTGGSVRIPAAFNQLFGLRVTTGLISRGGFSPLVHFQDTPGPMGRTALDVAALLDAIVGYDPDDPFTAVAWQARSDTSYAEAVAVEVPLSRWRIGVLESAFGSGENPDAARINRVIRPLIDRLGSLGVTVVGGLEIAGLAGWIAETSVYTRVSKSDITRFLAARPGAPVASFMEIYESGRFHPENDLFHAIADGDEDELEVLRARLKQAEFQRLVVGLLAAHELDFLVCPTVQVVGPTLDELAAGKYTALTFPTNTVIASQAGLPALTVPAGFSGDFPVGLEVIGLPLREVDLLQFGAACSDAR